MCGCRYWGQVYLVYGPYYLVLSSVLKIYFSKMTFANISEATALSQRVFHRSQNTFNRIQNSFMTNEIHDQGKFSSMISP